jgi:hypothetical protein
MATFFKNKIVKNVGTVPVEIFSVPAASKCTGIGLSIANLLDGNTRVSITVKDDTSITGFYVKDVMIAPNASLRAINGGEKLILPGDNILYVYADQDDAVDVIFSFVEIV